MRHLPTPPAAPPAERPPALRGGRVYMLRIWPGTPPRTGFRALVRPVEAELWLGFSDPAELLAYLTRAPFPPPADLP